MMSALPDLGFIHNYVPGTDRTRPPLLLLHGTGGDENDLLPFGERLAPGAALLSPRGKVSEQGAARFFRRLAEGVFDQEDLALRTQELAEFIERARRTYGLAKPIAFGFSNGANIAASLLLTRPEVLAGAVLLRAMTPFEPKTLPDLTGIPVLMLSGAADPLVKPDDRDRLAKLLAAAGAEVTHEVVPAGHNLAPRDIATAEQWFAYS
jgi:phospholipase/carboxylesterase